MVKLKLRLILIAFVMFTALTLSNVVIAQTVEARLDTNRLRIGEQTLFTISLKALKERKYTFPVFTDTLSSSVEIVTQRLDTLTNKESSEVTYRQTYSITSFDSGTHIIPVMRVLSFVKDGAQADTLLTKPFALEVGTLAVDTTKDIMDIKEPMEVPFAWREYLPYIIGGLVGLAAIVIIVWLIIKRMKRPKLEVKVETPKEPPHIIALRELERVRAEKIWTQGLDKDYHSQLTEIIRTYIERRYNIPALEQTSNEVLGSFKNARLLDVQTYEKLTQMLHLADMVKFAKLMPLPNENELSMENAFYFVKATALDEKAANINE